MCIAHPAMVLEIKDNLLKCDFLGVEEVCVGTLCSQVEVGDYVLIHGGYAIQILDPEEAKQSLEVFEELSNIDIKDEHI